MTTKKNKLKILICGTTYYPSFNGQAIFTTSLAEGLANRGHEVWMVTPSEYGKPYQIDHNSVHIYTVSSVDLKAIHENSYTTFVPDLDVIRLYRRFKPDIVHLHDHYPLSKCILKFARRQNIPVIGTNHFVPENLAPYVPLLPKLWPVFNRLLWWWMKRVYNHLDLVTAPSQTAVNILKSQGLRVPAYPISCGVDFSRFRPIPHVDRSAIRQRFDLDPTRTTFLFVGRVDAEKKLDILIRAIRHLNRPDIQLAVTGSGAALHAYQALVEELSVQDQVRFTGFVSDADLPLLHNSVDVFAMPSEAELLSIASLEAMATGLPLLVARSKALPELVNHGQNGYLFAPGSVEDAARWMGQLADHPETWPSMGAASLEKVQPHSIDNVLERYENLYRVCLTGKPD
jgi:glycosyltransferase involved in cell wall biosynthesis